MKREIIPKSLSPLFFAIPEMFSVVLMSSLFVFAVTPVSCLGSATDPEDAGTTDPGDAGTADPGDAGTTDPEPGEILINGLIEIQLNKKPIVLIKARGKANYVDHKLIGDNYIKKPKIDFSDEQVEFLANNVVAMRDITLEQAEAIKERNPNFVYTGYTSSTYVKHWLAEESEKDYMQHLAMSPAAVLESAISKTDTEFSLLPYIFPQNNITEWYYKEVHITLEKAQKKYNVNSLNELIPIHASKLTEGWSQSTENFLFFVRIGKELMLVKNWNPSSGTIQVIRGFNGSEVSAHEKNAVVTSPIYNKSGVPLSERTLKPGKAGKLYYCSDKAADNLPILERRAQKVLEMMQEDGFDGSALDVMGASLPQFAMVNAIGLKTVPWDFSKNRLYSVPDWVAGHDRMIGIMQSYIHQRLGKWPVLQANGLTHKNFEQGQGDGGYSKRLLVPTDLKPRPMDSYHTEKGLAAAGSAFIGQMTMLQIGFREHLGVSMAMKAPMLATDQQMYDRAMIYASAFLYMGYEPYKNKVGINKEGTGVIVGLSFLSPFFHLPTVGPGWTNPDGGMPHKFGLPYGFYLPLGKPLESPEPGDLEALRYENTNVFVRRYENGLVMINPTSTKNQWKFEGDDGSIDPADNDDSDPLSNPETYTVKLDQRYIDVQIGDYVKGEITLPPLTGKIFLINPSL